MPTGFKVRSRIDVRYRESSRHQRKTFEDQIWQKHFVANMLPGCGNCSIMHMGNE
jgi:hypothetical protein